MAYFGGENTYVSWSRLDRHSLIILSLLLLCIVALSVVLIMRPAGSGSSTSSAISAVVENKSFSEAGATREVFVAAQTIQPGRKLSESLFDRKSIAVSDIKDIEDRIISDPTEFVGGYSTSVIVANTPLVRDSVTRMAPTNVITAKIPEGFRAVSIPVDAESAVEGWARPGAKVDVVWTTDNRGKQIVTTIVENAEVLSAEQSTESSSGPVGKDMPKHITLLVSAKDAQKIQLAKSAGTLSLNLRGDSDSRQTGSDTISLDGLIKNRDLRALAEDQGEVKVDGKKFTLRAGELVRKTD